MKDLFYPHSLAIIGASDDRQKVSTIILHNILKSYYKGDLFLVNPNKRRIEGIPCFHQVQDLPTRIDVAIICLSKDKVISTLEELGKRVVKYAIIVSSEFRDVNDINNEELEQIKQISKLYNIRVIGPNSFGIINTESNSKAYNGAYTIENIKSGKLSIISQSSGVISSFLNHSFYSVNKAISLGNTTDIEVSEVLEYFIEDKMTEIIFLYIEDIKDNKKVAKLIQKSSKPIVILQGYNQDTEYRKVIFKEVGAIEVDTITEAKNIIKFLFANKNISKYGMAIVSNSGSVTKLTSKLLQNKRYFIKSASIQNKTKEQLQRILPYSNQISNIVDLSDIVSLDQSYLAIETILSDKQVGSILLLVTPSPAIDFKILLKELLFIVEKYSHKIILPVFLGKVNMSLVSKYLVKNNIAYYLDIESALMSIDALYRYNHEVNNNKLWSTPTVYIKKSVIDKIEPKITLNKDEEDHLNSKILSEMTTNFDLPLNLEKEIKNTDLSLHFNIVTKNYLGKFLTIDNLNFELDNSVLATVPMHKPNIQKILRNIPNYDIIKDIYDMQSLINILFQLSLLANSFKEIRLIKTNIVLEKESSYIKFIKILV